MSEQDLRAMLAKASARCEREFNRRGELAAMWQAITSDGELLFIPAVPGLDKHQNALLVRALFEVRDVKIYLFWDEGFVLDRRGGGITPEEREQIGRGGLSEHPDRVEVILFMGEDASCGEITAQRKIIRPPNGKPYLGPLEIVIQPGDRVISEGRLIGMLPVKGTKQ